MERSVREGGGLQSDFTETSESPSLSSDVYNLSTEQQESIKLASETASFRKCGQSRPGAQVGLRGCRQWLR